MNANASLRRPSAVPLIVTGLVAYWLAVVVAMHLLEPEFDPVKVPMSLYVLGTYGVWMTTSFFAAAAICFLLGFGLMSVLPPTLWTKAGIVLFCVAGCGEIVMGLFPIEQPLTSPLTPHNAIHLYGGLAALYSIALGSISYSVSFRGDEQWRPSSTAAIVVSLATLAMVYTHFSWFKHGMDGLTQRIAAALMLLWFGLTLNPWLRWSSSAASADRRLSARDR
jgi:uncharacterized protein DUF998